MSDTKTSVNNRPTIARIGSKHEHQQKDPFSGITVIMQMNTK
jgi:hypothetical protein